MIYLTCTPSALKTACQNGTNLAIRGSFNPKLFVLASFCCINAQASLKRGPRIKCSNCWPETNDRACQSLLIEARMRIFRLTTSKSSQNPLALTSPTACTRLSPKPMPITCRALVMALVPLRCIPSTRKTCLSNCLFITCSLSVNPKILFGSIARNRQNRRYQSTC